MTIDIANTTVSQSYELQKEAVQEFCNDFANASAKLDAIADLFTGGFPTWLDNITKIIPGQLDQGCQQYGLGSYLQATGQAPAPVVYNGPNPIPPQSNTTA